MTTLYDQIADERDRLGRRAKILAGQLEQRRAQHVTTTDQLREAHAYIATLEGRIEAGDRALERANRTLESVRDVLTAELDAEART